MTVRARTERNAVTRERILDAAERLFAEHGVYAVSHRAIAEAAGQGNTAVVGYHFGAKVDLVRAILARHTGAIERFRVERVAGVTGSSDLRDWVECLIMPVADHLAELGVPTWFARFAAQIMTDPVLREVVTADSLAAPALQDVLDGLARSAPVRDAATRQERGELGRLLLVHAFAEREVALAAGAPTPRVTWTEAGQGLVDALVGMWLALTTTSG